MTETDKSKNLFARIAAFIRSLFPGRLEIEQGKAMRDLMSKNDSHLLDDIGVAAPNDNRQRPDSDEQRTRRPWLL